MVEEWAVPEEVTAPQAATSYVGWVAPPLPVPPPFDCPCGGTFLASRNGQVVRAHRWYCVYWFDHPEETPF